MRPSTVLVQAPPDDPVTRDGARDAADREVSKEIYHQDDPGLLEQAYDRVVRWLDELFGTAASAAPGGAPGLVVILLVVALLIAGVFWRVGSVRRNRRRVLDTSTLAVMSAREHRHQADAHAAAGRYREAVRERMRAIVGELEDRGVLEPRPGRTADEVAHEAGAEVPDLAATLRRAASIFDEVWYGDRPASAGSDAALRETDDLVRRTSLRIRSADAAPPGYAVPR